MPAFLSKRFCEGGQIGFVPTYGNTLMGLARHHPIGPENDYSIAYYAPQPREFSGLLIRIQTKRLIMILGVELS